VDKSYYANVNGHLEQTLRVAADPEGATFPVGTIVQLAPVEAMVKRHAGFSPETGDWEFFKLAVVGDQAVIVERGTTAIRNIAGTCQSCHAPAAGHDWVCATGRGCEPLPKFVLRAAIKSVEKDPRCGG